MTEAVRRAGVAAAAAALVASCLVLAACGARRTPPPPPKTTPSLLETMRLSGAPELRPYLDAFPLGDLGTRVDLLAASDERSMHLVQSQRPMARHKHPTRTETVYVLTGSGTFYVADRSYPVAPGSTFRVEPGIPHSAHPAEGVTIVAISYFEPPLVEGDDRVLVD